MKKLIRKLILVTLTVTMLLTMAVPTMAKEKNVTKSLSETSRENIVAMTNLFKSASAYQMYYKLDSGEKQTISFSSSTAKKEVVKAAYIDCYPKKTTKTLSKWLFGKAITGISPSDLSWGSVTPSVKVGNIYKRSDGTYRVHGTVSISKSGYTKKLGTINLYLTKKKGTHFGYIATKIAITSNK